MSRSPAVLTLPHRGQGRLRSRQNHFAPQQQTWYQRLVLAPSRSGMCPGLLLIDELRFALQAHRLEVCDGRSLHPHCYARRVVTGVHRVAERNSWSLASRIRSVIEPYPNGVGAIDNFFARGGHKRERFGKNVNCPGGLARFQSASRRRVTTRNTETWRKEVSENRQERRTTY
jgi:hypothetical protein